MRLIDADALKQKILEERNKIPLTVPAAHYELVREKANTHGNAMRGGIRIALRCMENTPTIEAEPVRHGKWVLCEGFWICDKCGASPADWEAKPDNPSGLPPFCHSCGAKNDLEEMKDA